MTGHSAEKDAPYSEAWDASVQPGGYVCSQCGMPVESEPCAMHGPASDADPARVGKWADRDLFPLDADVTVYWPDVRPCYDAEWCACDRLERVHPYRTNVPIHEGPSCPATRVTPPEVGQS